MSTREKLIKARLGMLALAEELQNISLICRRAGISRSHFYEIKEAYEKWGAEGLAPQPRRKPRMPNQTPPELEAKILEMTEQYPAYSYIRIVIARRPRIHREKRVRRARNWHHLQCILPSLHRVGRATTFLALDQRFRHQLTAKRREQHLHRRLLP
jgi:Winged helix-turn helix